MFILVEPLELNLRVFKDHTQVQKINIPFNIKLVLLSLSTAIGPVYEKPPLHKGWHKAHDTVNSQYKRKHHCTWPENLLYYHPPAPAR